MGDRRMARLHLFELYSQTPLCMAKMATDETIEKYPHTHTHTRDTQDKDTLAHNLKTQRKRMRKDSTVEYDSTAARHWRKATRKYPISFVVKIVNENRRRRRRLEKKNNVLPE